MLWRVGVSDIVLKQSSILILNQYILFEINKTYTNPKMKKQGRAAGGDEAIVSADASLDKAKKEGHISEDQ